MNQKPVPFGVAVFVRGVHAALVALAAFVVPSAIWGFSYWYAALVPIGAYAGWAYAKRAERPFV